MTPLHRVYKTFPENFTKDEKCPYCNKYAMKHMGFALLGLEDYKMIDKNGKSRISHIAFAHCPDCFKTIIYLVESGFCADKINTNFLERLYPVGRFSPAPQEVDQEYAKDYNEAMNIIDLSPNASGALLRRCLQNILRNKIMVKRGDLYDEIKEYEAIPDTPSRIKKYVDTVRKAGNIGSHADVDKIVDITIEEVECIKTIIDMIFEHHFVEEKRLDSITEQISAKTKKK